MDPYISDTQPSIWHYGGDTSVTVTMPHFTPDITIADGQRSETALIEDGRIGLYQFLGRRPPVADGGARLWASWGRNGMQLAVRRHSNGSAEIAITGAVGDIVAHLPADAVDSLRDYLIRGPIDDEDDA
ncbi:hypothetical protein [Streptomyces xiamenensis]|uniref:hypothetical protein n=1 Tax=Streptomyces xiamenensis TaxID=408015 RepID=UPI003D74AF5A